MKKIKIDFNKVKLLKEALQKDGWGGAREGAGRPAGSRADSVSYTSAQLQEASNDWEDYGWGNLIKEISRGTEKIDESFTSITGDKYDKNEIEKARAQEKILQNEASTQEVKGLLYRGVVFQSKEDFESQFKNKSVVEMDALTATTPDEELALNYTDPQYGGMPEDHGYPVLFLIGGHKSNPVKGMERKNGEIPETILPKGVNKFDVENKGYVKEVNGRKVNVVNLYKPSQQALKRREKKASKSVSIEKIWTPLRKALPSPAQAKAGNYKKLHIVIDDLKITIENPKGSVRKGTDKEGNIWESTMEDHYGYILNAKGHDGDFLDCFVNPDIKAEDASKEKVYIIKQIKKEDGSFDENKVMLGYESRDAARDGYLRNYDPSWFQLDSMEEVTFEDFKNSIKTGYLKLEKSMKLIKCSEKLKKSMIRLTDLVKSAGWGGAREGAGRPKGSGSGSKVDYEHKDIQGKLVSKPNNWKEADSKFISVNSVDPAVKKYIESLPIHNVDNILSTDSTNATFVKQVPAQFVMQRGQSKYFVDTQGYDYPRYMSRLR